MPYSPSFQRCRLVVRTHKINCLLHPFLQHRCKNLRQKTPHAVQVFCSRQGLALAVVRRWNAGRTQCKFSALAVVRRRNAGRTQCKFSVLAVVRRRNADPLPRKKTSGVRTDTAVDDEAFPELEIVKIFQLRRSPEHFSEGAHTRDRTRERALEG